MEKESGEFRHTANDSPLVRDDSQHIQERNLATMTARLNDMKEVQARLNVGRSTAFDLVNSGRLRSVRLGRRRLVPESALVEFIESLG
jgi:excisionase family DNA binding protein